MYSSFDYDPEDVTLMGTNFSKPKKQPQKETKNDTRPRVEPINTAGGQNQTRFADAQEILNDDFEDEIEVLLFRDVLHAYIPVIKRKTQRLSKKNTIHCKISVLYCLS